MQARARTALAVAALAATALNGPALGAQADGPTGFQDPAWAPDGRRVAVSYLDRIWTVEPDGRRARQLDEMDRARVEREPAWSPDGRRIAFAADHGDGFDIFVAPAGGGQAAAATAMPGDERWPSWTPDGRLVFAHREPPPPGRTTDPGLAWDLYLAAPVAGSAAWQSPVPLTTTVDNETFPRVSPDGTRVAFVSDRESEDDVDLWVLPVPPATVTRPEPLGPSASEPADPGPEDASRRSRPRAVRITDAGGTEAHPTWDPDGARLAYYAERENVGSVWVAPVPPPAPEGRDAAPAPRPRPSAGPMLVSRRGGAPAWSPDGTTLLVAGMPDPQPVYNGNPLRSEDAAPPLFAGGSAFRLWHIAAPAPVDESGGLIDVDVSPDRATLVSLFDRTWRTLRDLYYTSGPSAEAWMALRDEYRPEAGKARDSRALERVLDEMVAEQPLIKPEVTSSGTVIVSGHPLASRAGRLAIEKGGNIVDAMIAVSFALGVVEPEASGVGGDGTAVLYLKGMERPTVIDYKDETPIRATPDNPAIVQNGRVVADGPAATNIPGVVAGLDYLYRHYASGKVSWADLIAPAIELADEGFVLDQSLPTTIAEGRRFLEKYPAAARIYLPGGKVPRPGDTFVNPDYANTLRAIARDGAETFYRGAIARQIAKDMEANGGIIGYADLAQYRAIERAPVRGHYRGNALYAGGPPLSTGIQLFESLQVLEQYLPKPGARLDTDADYFHYLIEAWKVRDPLRRVADPDRWPVNFTDHLTDAHARMLFERIDPAKASPYPRPPRDTEPFLPPAHRIGTGTTSFAVADAEGNMIAVTQTLSTWGGTFYVSKDLGFLYNNHLKASRTTEGAYGSMLPLMRSSTSSVPTLVFRETPSGEVPRLAVGCAGNAWIPVTVYDIITGVIDGGLSAQAAIEAPRFLPGRDPGDPQGDAGLTQIEDRIPRDVLDELEGRGHRFQKIGRKGEVRYGYAAAIVVDDARHEVRGGAEPRRSHTAVAVERN